MQKIGQGWQYRAYELPDGRVLKKKHSYLSQFWYIFWQKGRWTDSPLTTTLAEMKKADRKEERAYADLHQQMQHIPDYLLANPEFLSEKTYTQDRVVTINHYFEHHSTVENKRIVDMFLKFVFLCWEYGFCDTSFEYQHNVGLDTNGRVVLIDFGEVSFSQAVVTRELEKEKWRSSWSHRHMQNKELKTYYNELMKKELTKPALERRWGRRR